MGDVETTSNSRMCGSILLFVVGVVWLLVLPYDGYNKRTYISENALLPGQVSVFLATRQARLLRNYAQQANLDYGFNDIRTAEDYRDKLVAIQDKDSET